MGKACKIPLEKGKPVARVRNRNRFSDHPGHNLVRVLSAVFGNTPAQRFSNCVSLLCVPQEI